MKNGDDYDKEAVRLVRELGVDEEFAIRFVREVGLNSERVKKGRELREHIKRFGIRRRVLFEGIAACEEILAKAEAKAGPRLAVFPKACDSPNDGPEKGGAA